MENIMFSIFWDEYKGKFEHAIQKLEQVNVVLHAKAEQHHPQAIAFHNRIFGATNNGALPTAPRLAAYSSVKMAGKTSHYRLNGAAIGLKRPVAHGCQAGKILCFGSGNVIRAGKHTHAHGLERVFHFWNWVDKEANLPQKRWPAAIQAPNMVVSGKFKFNLDPAIKKHPMCTSTSKFPGIQVVMPKHLNATPEVYTKRGTFIVPGVTSPKQLDAVLSILVPLCESFKA